MFTLNGETNMDALVLSNETRFLNHAPHVEPGDRIPSSAFSGDESSRGKSARTANCSAHCEFL